MEEHEKQEKGALEAESADQVRVDPRGRANVVVGEVWPGSVDISFQEEAGSRTKRVLICWFAGLLGSMLAAFMVYGMATGNQGVLSAVLGIVQSGLVIVAVWAGGSATLNVLSRFKPGEGP